MSIGYTLISQEAFRRLINKGILYCDEQGGQDVPEEFERHYQWMMTQMERRGMPKPPQAKYPLWCWTTYDGVQAARPDYFEENGETGVLVKFLFKEPNILKSDFALWSAALNDCYLPPHDNPDAEDEDPRAIEHSWLRVFDLDNHYRDFSAPPEERCIQGCIWGLHIVQVIKYERIEAKQALLKAV